MGLVQADKEQAQFEAEWRKLGSIIDQDKRNRELVRQREMEERDRKTQEARAPRHCVLMGRTAVEHNGKLGIGETCPGV